MGLLFGSFKYGNLMIDLNNFKIKFRKSKKRKSNKSNVYEFKSACSSSLILFKIE